MKMRPDHESALRRAQARVGTTLKGKWTLDCLVGLGGMAAVYAATHRNRKRVAVKILHPELSAYASLRERFQREGYVANTVKHPGVVSVDDDDVTEDGCSFLVMELVEGETLETRLERRGPLTVREVLGYANQVLDTLVTAHARGVVHRDIKPDNLLLGTNGVVKILDFGISQLREGDTDPSEREGTMGTPGFMAPEQAMGWWDEVDAQSDLWAVGATMFNLLTGHYIQADEIREGEAVAGFERPASPRAYRSDLDEDITRIVERALEPDKAARWPDAATMLRAVREAYFARDQRKGPPRQKATRRERGPGAAWHRALRESSVPDDERDTLETLPPTVDMAAPAGHSEVLAEPDSAPLPSTERTGPPSEHTRGQRAMKRPTPSSAVGRNRVQFAQERRPSVSRHAHTTTARGLAAAPRHPPSPRWSLAITLAGVVIVVLSVVFTVRRSQEVRGQLVAPTVRAAAAPAVAASVLELETPIEKRGALIEKRGALDPARNPPQPKRTAGQPGAADESVPRVDDLSVSDVPPVASGREPVEAGPARP